MTMNTIVLIALVYLLLTLCIFNLAPARVRLVWGAPWLALDCLASWCIGETFHATLSAKAWDARTHVTYHWTWTFIDMLFGTGHCEDQWLREQHYGSVWTSWAAQWRGEVFTRPATTLEG